MVSDEFEVKALERGILNRENQRRNEVGLESKPIPFSLMSEQEQEKRLIEKRQEERDRAKYGN